MNHNDPVFIATAEIRKLSASRISAVSSQGHDAHTWNSSIAKWQASARVDGIRIKTGIFEVRLSAVLELRRLVDAALREHATDADVDVADAIAASRAALTHYRVLVNAAIERRNAQWTAARKIFKAAEAKAEAAYEHEIADALANLKRDTLR